MSTNGHIKTFVVDTNVLLHNPNAIFMFADNEVVIPFDVIEELDKFKTSNDDLGRNARTVIRHLDRLRESGNLAKGVDVKETGGRVRVILEEDQKLCPGLTANTPDNRIICTAYALHQEGKKVVFISKDINARIKSDTMGITTQDFEAQKVDFEHLYTGWREFRVSGDQIDSLYQNKQLKLQPPDGVTLYANEYILLKDQADDSHTALARYKSDGIVIPIRPRRGPVFGIMPRNLQQTMALDLLLDDSVKLVSLIGTAGTGKTLLAIAAGMTKVLNEQAYHKLLVARPIMPLGRDIGYLPGDKDEKLTAWMQPIFDNMSYLLSNRLSAGSSGESGQPTHASLSTVEQRIKQLMESGQVVLEPLTYIRGRSIPHQFMIVDEAQNLTPHEVKTIASRVGDGTKLVLTGDASQIDNPYLDSSSNGLSYLVERLKGKPIVGHITLAKSERSELASLVTAEL
jgi:PhoH-like ATPase